MNRSMFGVWLAIAWIVSLGVAYLVGWYTGLKNATSVALTTAHSSFDLVLVVLVVVALGSAFAAYRARGYFSGRAS